MRILNQGFDHVEFIVSDIAKHAALYEQMGFEKIGERAQPVKGLKTLAMAQGFVRILLTQADGSAAGEKQEATKFLRKHAEGICVLAIEVDDAAQAFQETVARGARPAREPETFSSPEGTVVRSEIWTPADVRYAFIERHGASAQGTLTPPQGPALFDDGLVVSRLESPAPFGIRIIDHLTNNVGIGDLKTWTDWYQKVFAFELAQHFHIKTGRTGLNSDVVQSVDHKVKVPVNEATEPESQVQEFVDRMKGAGVQHLALTTDSILDTVARLRKGGISFLSVPHTYYEAVPKRISGVTEDLRTLEDLGILVDGEQGTGYLLQIFTVELVGPFFFEFIQRKGDRGFGNGNFRALFEAIERDQIARGVLRA